MELIRTGCLSSAAAEADPARSPAAAYRNPEFLCYKTEDEDQMVPDG